MRTMLFLLSTVVMFSIGAIVLVMIIVLQLLIYFAYDESDSFFQEELPPHFNLVLRDPLVFIVTSTQFAVLNTNWNLLSKQKHP